MREFKLVLDIVIFITMVICVIYHAIKGIINHDTYYLVLGLFDYIILQISEKDIENYIDNMDDM